MIGPSEPCEAFQELYAENERLRAEVRNHEIVHAQKDNEVYELRQALQQLRADLMRVIHERDVAEDKFAAERERNAW